MNLFDFLAHENDELRALTSDPDYRLMRAGMLLVSGLLLAVLGAALCFGFAFQSTRTETTGYLWWEQETSSTVPTGQRVALFLGGVAFTTIGLWFVRAYVRHRRRERRWRKYTAVLSGVEVMKVQQISDITGHAPAVVYKDLERMIGRGLLAGIFLDYQREQVVATHHRASAEARFAVACSACGGRNEVVAGAPRPCAYCGQVVAAR